MSKESLIRYQKELGQIQLHPSEKGERVPWIVSEPFEIGREQLEEIEQIGNEIREFLLRCWRMSRKEAIKREFYGSLSERQKKGMERIGNSDVFPILVRPDLIIDDKGKFWINEIDLAPAHAGVLQRMQEVYGQRPTIADLWAELITEEIVLSIPKWKSFVREQWYFAQRVQEKGGRMRFVEIEEWDKISEYKGVLFKNCCTLDLLSEEYPPYVPPNAILCPPLVLDWKGWMAFAHREEALRRLPVTERIPETYLLPLKLRKESEKRKELIDLSRKEREGWILKPVASWGGYGFKEGRNLNMSEWNQTILGLPGTLLQGIILQKRISSARYKKAGLSASGELVTLEKPRIKMTPYYLFWHGKSRLAGVKVTLRESLKVHGARDAIITLAVCKESGGTEGDAALTAPFPNA